MKTTILQLICLATAMLTSTTATFATPISIEFGGTITQFDYRSRMPDQTFESTGGPGIAINDPFSVTVNYDDANATIPGAVNGRYAGGINPAMIVTCGDAQFTLVGPMRWGSGGDSFRAGWDAADAKITTTWDESMMYGVANLAYKWTGTWFILYGGNGNDQFNLRGEITSTNRVPETLPTGLALAFASSLLMALRRHLS